MNICQGEPQLTGLLEKYYPKTKYKKHRYVP